MKYFDLLVLGSGEAGTIAAEKYARSGLKVAFVDKDPVPPQKEICTLSRLLPHIFMM